MLFLTELTSSAQTISFEVGFNICWCLLFVDCYGSDSFFTHSYFFSWLVVLLLEYQNENLSSVTYCWDCCWSGDCFCLSLKCCEGTKCPCLFERKLEV